MGQESIMNESRRLRSLNLGLRSKPVGLLKPRWRFFNPNHLRLLFKKVLKAADLPDVRFHDLRDGAATVLLVAKMDLKAISEMLGDSSVAITADIYQSVLAEQQQEIVKKMDDLYGTH